VKLLERKCNIHEEYIKLLSNVEIIVDRKDEAIYTEITSILNIYKLELQTKKLTDEFSELCG
jgi:hypothetical protein